MRRVALLLVPVAVVAGVVAARAFESEGSGEGAAPEGTKEVNVANPYAPIAEEPPPQLFVDPPDPKALEGGVVWIQYRVENLRILPVFGKGGRGVSPRVGHLHIHVDDVPWWWADSSGLNTIDLAGMPPGEHKVRIVLVDTDHEPFPGQSKTVTFTVPESAPTAH